MRKLNKRLAVIAVGAVGALATSGVAFAFWTASGSGDGHATTASSSGTVTLHAAFAGNLTPGATQDVTYTADNSGSSSVHVGTITPVVSIDAIHTTAGCHSVDFTATAVDANANVAGGATGVVVGSGGTITFHDTDANQDACKGATVTLTLTSN